MAKFIEGGLLGACTGTPSEVTEDTTAPSGYDDLVLVIYVTYFNPFYSDNPYNLQNNLTVTYDGTNATYIDGLIDPGDEDTDSRGTACALLYVKNPSGTKEVYVTFDANQTGQAADRLVVGYAYISEVDLTNTVLSSSIDRVEYVSGDDNEIDVSLTNLKKNSIAISAATLRGTGTDNQTNVYDDLQAGKPNMMGSYKKVVDTGSINMSYSSEKDVDIMVGAVLKDSGGTYPKTINIT